MLVVALKSDVSGSSHSKREIFSPLLLLISFIGIHSIFYLRSLLSGKPLLLSSLRWQFYMAQALIF
ncbi:hypothetical protein LINGRAPRIM_LOCUS2606 [Linum grandiflorum]